MSSQDTMFLLFLRAVFVLMVLFGFGMTVVIIWGDSSIGSRMVSGFVSMFAAVIGLGSGYLLGARQANGHAPGGEDE